MPTDRSLARLLCGVISAWVLAAVSLTPARASAQSPPFPQTPPPPRPDLETPQPLPPPGAYGAPVPGGLQGYPPPQGAPPVPAGPPLHISSTHLRPGLALARLGGSVDVAGWAYGGFAVGTLQQWVPVCQLPCDVPVEPNQVYSVRGFGVRPSYPFLLPPGATSLQVRPGSAGLFSGGVVLASLGAGLLVAGLVVVGTGAAFANDNGNPDLGQTDASLRNGFYIGGAVMSVAGAGMLAGGIAMALRGRTLVRLPDGQRLALGRGLALTARGLAF